MPNYKSSFLWFPNVAAMSSFLLDSTDEDGLMFAVGFNVTDWKLAVWRKNSTATIDNSKVFAANGLGRWIVLPLENEGGGGGGGGGGAGGALATVSSVSPSTIQPVGTVYVWTEDSSETYSPDVEGRYPNSVITYVSNGSAWITTSANKIFYADNPDNLGKPPNDIQEEWVDISDPLYPVYYCATINSSIGISWVQS